MTNNIAVALEFSCVDPEHQRATGNRKYFEFQLEKQKNEAEKETYTEKELGKRETGEEKKKSKKKVSNHLIPERKKYEMLCRGEGIRMVRNTIIYTQTQFPTYCTKYASILTFFVSRFLFRRPGGRADCSVVTMTTNTTPNMCCHLSNSKMSGIALTLSATLTSFQTKRWRGSSSWQSRE